jgi:hypothetical protein
MTEVEILRRHIFLKFQAIFLVGRELLIHIGRLLQLIGALFMFKIKTALKCFLMLVFCRGLMSQSITQRLYNFFRLKKN